MSDRFDLSLPPPPSPPSDGDAGAGRPAAAVEAAVQGVWARMRDTVLARVDPLDDAVAALVEGRLAELERDQAERAAHKLAGSAGTFGFDEASRVARRLERRFAAQPSRDEGWAAAEEVTALRAALEEAADAAPAPAPAPPGGVAAGREGPEPGGRVAVVLTEDRTLAARLGDARDHRLRLVVAGDHAQARALVAARRPAAVLVDAHVAAVASVPPDPASASSAVAPALAALGELDLAPDVATFLLTDADSQLDRVAAARADIDGFLSRDLPAAEVTRAVAAEVATAPAARVLACDDDPAILEAVAAVLAGDGCVVDTLVDPRGFWAALRAAPPDLVLLDLAMPHVDGLQLCRVLRSDPAHAALPVMFLTAHTDRGSVQQAFDAGADDVVAKPLVEAELRARVGNRLERSRLLARLADTDPLTGLAHRRAGRSAAARLLARAADAGRPATLARLDLDGFAALNEAHGHDTGDAVLSHTGRVLRHHVGGGDVAARWAGDELVVVLDGADAATAGGRLGAALAQLQTAGFNGAGGRAVSASFSGGLAEHPADGTDVDALHEAAHAGLRAAQRAGGACVRHAGEARHGPVEACDVAIVDDDPALVDLLRHTLDQQGYRVAVVDDGGVARRRLLGEAADLRPRLLLLDVDLPGLSGLELLGELRDGGLLARTPVLMLTGRASERETLEALRLGAIDHMGKPFSLPVLLERIKRALGA